MDRTRRPRSEQGVAAVEFALVVPLLCALLFGIISGGMMFSDKLAITSAVREGARFGSGIDYSPAPATWASSVATRVGQSYTNNTSTLDAAQICVSLTTADGATLAQNSTAAGAGCGDAPASPTGMATGSCVVKVWVRKPQSISPVIAPTLQFDIGARSVSYYGRRVAACTAE